jgi:hypothetical protein
MLPMGNTRSSVTLIYLNTRSLFLRWFDMRSARIRVSVIRHFLGRGVVSRRGGTSWELEGTSPRLFLRALLERAATTAACKHAWPSKSIYPYPFSLTGRRPGLIREDIASVRYSVAARGIPWNLHSSAVFHLPERPHECQIGSGELIRTAVRETFESRWIRSSDSPLARSCSLARAGVRLLGFEVR